MFQKILIPLVGADLDQGVGVLDHVRRLLRESRAEVHLLRVLPDEYLIEGGAEIRRAVVEKVERHLGHVAGELAREGLAARSKVVFGDPAHEILEYARAIEPSLLAMATHARTGWKRFLLGSVAERVLRRSRAPVLLVHQAAAAGSGVPFGRILVPLDGFPLSEEILPLVQSVAGAHGSEVVLLHVVPLSPYATYEEFETRTPDSVEALLEPARRRLETSGLSVRVRIEYGDPSEEILGAALSESADLIAMTTHGRKGPARWVFGSVAEEVLRHSPCPLLVARTLGFAPGPEVAESDDR